MKRFLGLVVPLFLGACAALQQGDAMYAEKNLEKAGFHVVPATTPKQQAALARMTPYKLEGSTKNGLTVYRYADPREQKVYVGGEQEFRNYQAIVARHNMTDQTSLAMRTNWQDQRMMMW